jgi:hypothetical protein
MKRDFEAETNSTIGFAIKFLIDYNGDRSGIRLQTEVMNFDRISVLDAISMINR